MKNIFESVVTLPGIWEVRENNIVPFNQKELAAVKPVATIVSSKYSFCVKFTLVHSNLPVYIPLDMYCAEKYHVNDEVLVEDMFIVTLHSANHQEGELSTIERIII